MTDYEYHGRAINEPTRQNLRRGMDRLAATREAAEAAMNLAISSLGAARRAEQERAAQREALRNELTTNRSKGRR